ncbi:hypothetical protein GCM10027598_67460 [Amycolatopsis oliviviridis]|uniref:LSDAT prokaryote domain-containing protein n=2 Tax=Amycolatopsis oliviviridis TaxID=1471590 RepID=A0ABQ3M115_9PSEU|nr:hypothetical protein GCM10017790_63270 [Amycolatopsis oliviviridis]
MSSAHGEASDSALRDVVIPLVASAGITVVDGGTDSGVMRALGLARAAVRAEFPLVGVAAEGTLADSRPPAPGSALPEPRHTHLVSVPGTKWGDESPWLSSVARVIAKGLPVATLVINGGEVTLGDVGHSLRGGTPVVVLSGTGRAADRIAAARDPSVAFAARSPLTRVVGVGHKDELRRVLREVLGLG